MPGKGRLTLTGQLGDVMKESAQAAFTWTRSNYKLLGLKPDFDWKEIYNIFKEMPVTKDYSLDWKSPNADKIYEILSSHDFNRERINKLIERLTKKSISQKGLSSFFNS